jgi:hypothetical protein
MTRYGKMNLLAMLLPAAGAAVGSLMAFGGQLAPLLTVIGLNLIPMVLIGGPVAALMIRSSNRKHGGRGAAIAVWPTLIPGAITAFWYLYLALRPDAVAPQFETLAGPQYLLMGVVLMSVVAVIGWFIARRP